jgi:hypothetical protein
MEFLDIIFNKRLESFAPCYSQSLLLADLKKNPCKKIRETRKLRSFLWISFWRTENEGRKPDKNLRLRILKLIPGHLDYKMPFRNSISGNLFSFVFQKFVHWK